jgi:CRP-like cAMP-binding protein
MPQAPDATTFEQRLADLPVTQYSAGEDVLTAGSSTGRLLVLKSGAVEVVKDGVQIAKVSTPGAVFGELSILLDQPHRADVRALEQSEFPHRRRPDIARQRFYRHPLRRGDPRPTPRQRQPGSDRGQAPAPSR